jgi:hypothetical protein
MDIRSKIVQSGALGDCCAVIGNGPVKTDLSKQIDDSYVMRCNSFELHKGTGTATDLNITSLYNFREGRFNYPILGVLPISDNLYQKYVTVKDMHKIWERHAKKLIMDRNRVWLYDERDDYAKVFTEVAEAINAFPTPGMMGIATARWLKFPKIILSGFTFFKSGFVKPIAAHHNPEAERNLVRSWIDDSFILDELTKKALYDNQKD